VTFASKTDAPCDCGFLDRAAKDPTLPIEFDAELNEFHVVCAQGFMMIYHCPLCGGKAPESLRRDLFQRIPDGEAKRLLGLNRNFKNADEVISALGPPDADQPLGGMEMHPESDGRPPWVTAHRVLVYTHLSEVADLYVSVYPSGGVGFGLQGKYGGLPERDGQ
jgi:hypothetical protein